MAINLNHSRKDWNSEQIWRIELWLLSVGTTQQPRQSLTTFFGTLKHGGLKSQSRTFSVYHCGEELNKLKYGKYLSLC